MKQRFVTIITDQNGRYSIHASWRSACEEYGWEYKGRLPKKMEHEGMKIKKVPFDMTIDCLELYEFIGRKDIEQSYSEEEEGIMFHVSGYDTSFDILCEYGTKEEPDSIGGSDDMGREEHIEGGEIRYLTEVLNVYKYDGDDDGFTVNKYFQEQLLNFLKLD